MAKLEMQQHGGSGNIDGWDRDAEWAKTNTVGEAIETEMSEHHYLNGNTVVDLI